MIRYFAYGSNLHPVRLQERVPSARTIGVVELPGYRLAFHKRGADGSGKCLLYRGAGRGHRVLGVLFEFEAYQKIVLDRVEGDGYAAHPVQCRINGVTYEAYTYLAQATQVDPSRVPYHWYKDLVLAGARYHRFPEDYVAAIQAVPSRQDANIRRAACHEALLVRINEHPASPRPPLSGVARAVEPD